MLAQPPYRCNPDESARAFSPDPNENRLLASLPRREYARLLGRLKPVPLPLGEVLGRPGEPIPHVHFPRGGVIPLIAALPDGRTAEVGMVGSEGMAGVAAFLGSGQTPFRMLVQVPGEGLRMRAEDLKGLVRGGALRGLLFRYLRARLALAHQATACNLLHSAEHRLRRWLLMVHDRVLGGQFPVTQQFLQEMLALNRSRVSLLAGRIQRAGQIRYRRGNMVIVDRAVLEAGACACYGVVREEFQRLLGWPLRARGP